VSQSDGQGQQRRASRRHCSSDSKDQNHSSQSIDGIELMLLQQQLALAAAAVVVVVVVVVVVAAVVVGGRPVSCGLGGFDRLLSDHVTASLRNRLLPAPGWMNAPVPFQRCSRPLNRPQKQESAVMRGFSWQELSADDVWKCAV
jgi:hypothetical protein